MNKLPKILAVDDDPTWLQQVPLIFEDEAEVTTSQTISDALIKLSENFFDIVLLDLNFEGDYRTGLDVFKKIAQLDSQIDVVVISGETRMERIVEVCNAGVARILQKPCVPDRIRKEVFDVLSSRKLKRDAMLASQKKSPLGTICGMSAPVLTLKEEIQRAVDSGVKDILILGETGTGKEVVARAIAQLADPAARLMPINCGAISDSLAESELFGHSKGAFTGAMKDRASIFEIAAGGFVFLDEIGEMSPTQQAKILRVLQERKVTRLGETQERNCNFRTIAATHVNISEAIQSGRFREDLYYRLSKAIVRVPALRERIEDIPHIVERCLLNVPKEKRREFGPSAMNLLMQHDWPGNVRQLLSIIEAVTHNGNIGLVRDREIHSILSKSSIQQTVRSRSFLGVVGAELAAKERHKFQKAMMEAEGNKQRAAQILGMSRATFYRRLSDLGLSSN
jgi:DNA-binding NtrC family response regulator